MHNKQEEDKNIHEAKKSLKAHIKFFESLLSHINGNDIVLRSRAMFAAWCLHKYINDGLVIDIETTIKQIKDAQNDDKV